MGIKINEKHDRLDFTDPKTSMLQIVHALLRLLRTCYK